MIENSASAKNEKAKGPAWKEIVAKYQKPAIGRGVWQVINTLIPYAALWYLMYLTLTVSWWLTLPLAVLAGGFLVRVFIISHDCGHRSFFQSRRANNILGFITGVLTFTPFHHWRWEHAIHHATSGDLDRRGTGDVWTLTVQEYLESSRWKRFAYRLARNPVILFGLAPLFLFLIKQRFPAMKAAPRERYSVYWTNLAILGIAGWLSFFFGLKAYLFLQFIRQPRIVRVQKRNILAAAFLNAVIARNGNSTIVLTNVTDLSPVRAHHSFGLVAGSVVDD